MKGGKLSTLKNIDESYQQTSKLSLEETLCVSAAAGKYLISIAQVALTDQQTEPLFAGPCAKIPF